MSGPIDWGRILSPINRPKRKRLHSCQVKECQRLTSAKYCAVHMQQLKWETFKPSGSPSLRELREANQARLKRERET